MKSNELIKQGLQNLISAANVYIVEEDFEFEGQSVKAYLVLPPSLKSRSEEVAEAVFTQDVLDENSEEISEMEVVTEEVKPPVVPKKTVVKKATKKAKK